MIEPPSPQISSRLSMDDIPWTRLHLLAAICTLGGTTLDGYILGLSGAAISGAQKEMTFGALGAGLIGASALIGIFIGGLLFGQAADRWGRRPVFQWNLVAFVIFSVAQWFTVGVWDLVAYRIVLGLAIGVEYAVGAALLSEFVPKRTRGALLATLQAIWIAGFVVANIVGYLMPSGNWRVMLATSAIPAAFVAILRYWLPESPRWLASRGRVAEAEKILAERFPAGTTLPEVLDVDTSHAKFSELFRTDMWRSAAYAGIFWGAQVGPLFAIFTFVTPVLDAIGLPGGTARDYGLNFVQLAGALVFIWIVARCGRRPVVIYTFGIMLVALLLLGVIPNSSTGAGLFLTVVFGIYLAVAAGSANLEFVYPSEMFPTRLRSTGVGFAAAMSRVAASIAVYLLPVALDRFGGSTAILLTAIFPLVGLVASIGWARETKDSALG